MIRDTNSSFLKTAEAVMDILVSINGAVSKVNLSCVKFFIRPAMGSLRYEFAKNNFGTFDTARSFNRRFLRTSVILSEKLLVFNEYFVIFCL